MQKKSRGLRSGGRGLRTKSRGKGVGVVGGRVGGCEPSIEVIVKMQNKMSGGGRSGWDGG